MAVVYGRAALWGLLVSAFWLMLAAIIVLIVPTPEQASRTSAFGSPIGHLVHIYVPSQILWKIPVDRDTYDDYYRAVWDDDGDAINEVLSRSGWIAVADRQAVRVVDVDGADVQVELQDGQSAGIRAWLKMQHLSP
jgi:hypothetical protein